MTVPALCVALLSLSLSAAAQTTIHVPADVPTMQAAIVLARDGDTVRVAPGIYNEIIDYLGKAIVVVSDAGASATTIDGTGLFESVVTFHSEEGPDSVLRGFTVTGGNSTFRAGGISTTFGPLTMSTPRIVACVIRGNRTNVGNAGGVTGSPTLIDCVIEENFCPYDAGGVWGAPVMRRCIVRNNFGYDGGGIHLFGGRAEDCQITGNVAQEGTRGGGVYLEGDAVLERCLVAGNTSAALGQYPVSSAGVYAYAPSHAPLVLSCTIADNIVISPYVPPGEDCGGVQGRVRLVNSIVRNNQGVEIGLTTPALVAFSNIEGGQPGPGNFDADPLFVDAASGDYHLLRGSPCIDTGALVAGPDPDFTRADVGAFYYAQANTRVRNGRGVNPLLLSSVTPPALGTTWIARIDASLVPGATLSVITGRTQALDPGVLVAQGELLVTGSTTFGAAQASSGALDDFSFPIPNLAALIGFEGHAQGMVLGSGGLKLGNALVLALGN